jgi:hypothetical protein
LCRLLFGATGEPRRIPASCLPCPYPVRCNGVSRVALSLEVAGCEGSLDYSQRGAPGQTDNSNRIFWRRRLARPISATGYFGVRHDLSARPTALESGIPRRLDASKI